MKKLPAVSVIIPTYNRAHLVKCAVHSVLEQTCQDFELIVVDDASCDNTEEIVREFGDGRIRYIRHDKNRGGSAARNTGIKAARGEYIAFLDSDDEWFLEKLDEQLKVFEKSPLESLGIVYTGCNYVNTDGHILRQRVPEYRGDIFRDLLRANVVGSTSVAVVRAACLRQVGLFDERLPSSQDLDMWLRTARHYQFDFVPGPLARIRIHSGDERITNNLDAKIDGRELVFSKYRSDLEAASLADEYQFLTGKFYCRRGAPGDMARARDRFNAAIAHNPYQVKYYAFLVLGYLGSNAYSLLSRTKRKLRVS